MKIFTGKFEKNTIYIVFIWILLALNILFTSFYGFYENKVVPGEGPGILLGDKTCINDASKTLFEVNPVKKFENNWFCTSAKPFAISQDKDLRENLPLLFGYPAPSFRYGAALITGIITNIFPDRLFSERYSRPLFTNYVLTIFIVCMLLYIFRKRNKLILISIIVILLTDVSYYYNAYIYGTHTIAAIFFSIFAVAMLDNISKLKLFLFGLCLSLSLLSSSHLIILNLFIFCYGVYKYIINYKKNFSLLALLLIGGLLPVAHIIFVEKLYLPNHGYKIATYFEQQLNMVSAIDIISATFPLGQKFISNPNIFNPFFLAPLALVIIFKIINFENATLSSIKDRELGYFGISSILIGIITLVFLLLKSIPVSRAFILNSILIQVGLLCVCLGCVQNKYRYLFILIITSINLLSFIVRVNYLNETITPFELTHNKIIDYNNDNAYASKEISIFYNSSNEDHIKFKFEIGKLPNNSITVDEFLRKIKEDKRYEGIRFIRFDLLDQMYPYFAARRILPVYQHNISNVISKDTITNDYKLFFQLLDLDLRGNKFLYKSNPIIRRFSTWDQENNYLVLQTNFMKSVVGMQEYTNFDMNLVYYVDVEELISVLKE